MPERVDIIPGIQTSEKPRLMVRYVAGFAFDDNNRVLLVRKKVPRWQAGLLNGVGGKIEDGETPGQAMAREFKEETTLDTTSYQWKCFCVESHVDYEVHFFKAMFLRKDVSKVVSGGVNDVGEQLRWFFVTLLIAGSTGSTQLIGNLHWLIPMAQDWRNFQCRLMVRDNITERPTW